MTTFERGFADVERAATAAAQASGAVVAAAKQMHKAALDGDIAKIRKASDRLASVLEVARQEVANARSAWPFPEEEEEAYLRNDYEQELLEAANSGGLRIHRQEERLVAFPSVVRVMPGERAVRIDRTRVLTIRPTKLVALLKANQTRRPRFPSERFLEALFGAYRLVAGEDGMGKTVPLSSIYKAMTLLPDAASKYDRSDFGRDMFLLDRSGLKQARSGAKVSLPIGRGVFVSFVAPDGETVSYHGISFSEVD